MSTSNRDTPNNATVRVVTRLALGWAVAGLILQTVFSVAIAPALGEEVQFTIPGRGPTLAVAVDTSTLSVVGLVVAALAVLVAVGAVFLARRSARSAYAIAVVVCIAVPGFVILNLANGLFSLASGDGTSTGASLVVALFAVAGIAAGAISVAQAPKIAQRSQPSV